MATTGGEAVAAFVEARAAGVPFDVVLMDLHLPGMDGIEAARRIRATETGGTRTPIIALTADADPEMRDACLAAGMDGFVTKPLDRDRLNAAMADLAIRPCGVKRISQNLCKSPGICHKSVPGQ